MKEQKSEMPWAVPKKAGFKGEAPGLYFHYFRTRKEANNCATCLKRKGQAIGPVERRPGECCRLGWI